MWINYGNYDWAREYNRAIKPLRKDAKDLSKALEELFGAVGPQPGITESTDGWVITVPVPGLKKGDFHLARRGNKLTLSTNKDSQWLKQKSWAWTLEKGVKEKDISAECKDGIMKISIKRPEKVVLEENLIKIN
tara:strand:- start:12202 stop:12603 length:402 start_codon:yes stop_codon:yes gene_type:complete